jgi:hypothetical protein
MSLLGKSPTEIRAEYRRRHLIHLVLVALWTVYLPVMVFGGLVPEDQIMLYVFGGMAVLLPIDLINWRCPNCGHSFGRSFSEPDCPVCHAQFREGAPPGAAA